MKINKKKSLLLIGYGSIGEKHVKILKKHFKFHKIFIFTKRKIKNYYLIDKLKKIKKFNFDYIVVSSNTSKHLHHVKYIEKNFSKKKIFVEKPLFSKFEKFKIKKNKFFIGYNLRFHPLLVLLNKKIKKLKIYNIHVICNSFLPNWRKNIHYKNSSSSHKSKGGGVLLDLSHELDYIRWIFGNLSLNFVNMRRLSEITKNTEDTLQLIGKVNNANLSLDLNYFSRIPKRSIYIDGKNFSISVDLINNVFKMIMNKKTYLKKINKFNKNFTYIQLHKAILEGKIKNVCNYTFANETMKLIDDIKKFKTKKISK